MPSTPTRRSRSGPATDADERLQQRMKAAEEAGEGWRTIQTSDATPLRIIRGEGTGVAGGGVARGGGWTVSRFAAGVYIITFSIAFSGPPTVTASPISGSQTSAIVNGSPSATTCQIQTWQAPFTMVDCQYSFIAIGPA